MSQDAKATRPGQTTFAGWLILGGSVIVVISAWQRIAGLTSMETREGLRTVLGEPPFAGTGMEMSDLLLLVRIGCMVAAAAATAAAILGFHALRRSTSARLALSVLAPILLVGGFATAGFFAPLVAAGVVMLWLTPSREWFAGQPWRDKVESRPSASPPAARRVDPELPDPFIKPEQDARQDDEQGSPHGDEHGDEQGDEQGGGTPDRTAPASSSSASTSTAARSAPAAVSGFGAPATYAAPSASGRRPAALVWACALVWSLSGVVTGLVLLLSAVLLIAREEFFAEIERQQPDFDFQGFSQSEIAAAVFTMSVVVVVWSTVAVVLAVLAFRGSNAARLALLASTIGVGIVGLAMVLASPPVLVLVAAAGATVWLLLRPEVVGWYRSRRP